MEGFEKGMSSTYLIHLIQNNIKQCRICFNIKNINSIEQAYWMVENVFKSIHEEQLEKIADEKGNSPLLQERELDGKMDKKEFLAYVKG